LLPVPLFAYTLRDNIASFTGSVGSGSRAAGYGTTTRKKALVGRN
jgi:hypothetical protein